MKTFLIVGSVVVLIVFFSVFILALCRAAGEADKRMGLK
jgi:hypothetical protein